MGFSRPRSFFGKRLLTWKNGTRMKRIFADKHGFRENPRQSG
jgi:hypothetical protein